MTPAKKLIAITLAGAGVWGAWTLGQGLLGDDQDSAGTKHLVNQVWIERIPDNQRDMIGHLVFIRHDRGRIGGVGRSSQWRHFVELFHWGLEGSRLSLFFPQEEVRGQVEAQTWRCKGEAPHPFELCLRLSANGRSMVYYSREEWVIDPNDVESSVAELEAESPELTGVFDGLAVDDTTPIDGASFTETDLLSQLGG